MKKKMTLKRKKESKTSWAIDEFIYYKAMGLPLRRFSSLFKKI